MEKKTVLVLVTAALLPMAGCAKTDQSSGTVSTTAPPAAAASDTATTASPAAKIDRDVIQASASIEGAAKPSGEIGAPAPAWENLPGTDDKPHSLKELADAKAVVVVFTCNTCPVAQAYQERLVQLADDYKDKGVELVAINVNNDDGDKLPAMKERAEEKGFNFQYLYDRSQQIGRDYGATVTPHAFVLDAARKIAYEGAIDDNQDSAAVKEHYLRDAIDATLAGRQPANASTEQFGCGIRYE